MIKTCNSTQSNMSAQYRPYRNEDGTECDQSWGDQELGDVEIYQKTTEDIRVVSNRNLIVAAIGIAILGALLGLIIGYFAHSEHTECVPSLAVALHSVQDENPYIRKRILELVSTDEIEKYMKIFSSESHVAGSAVDKHSARTLRLELKKNGLDKVETADYTVLLSYPDNERPNTVRVLNEDSDVIFSIEAKPKRNVMPAFSAYSLPGNVSGNLVFVNYGRTTDFQLLRDRGIVLEGKILIAKQSHLSADEQAWNAQVVHAAGLILYPDPKEYNPPILKTDPYPSSWWLPGNVARSDSVLWNGVGDPLTPGYPARKDANRISLHSTVLPGIIVHPISYSDAYKLLSSLEGNEAPQEWQGGFNITYKIGPYFKDPTWKVQIQSYNRYVNKTISNVIGTLRGETEPDRYVLIGSHRDAWGYGALDSASGTAALLELSRVFGHLLKLGWRPRRTILFCSWGAEEYNLIGSTEWLEDNLKILHGRAVAYINTDVLVSGNSSLDVAASPLLYNAIFNATKEVPNPNEYDKKDGLKTVYDSWMATFPQKRNLTKLLYPEHAGKFDFQNFDELLIKYEVHNSSNLLDNYIKSAMQSVRPKVKKMDMRSNYSPFFVYAGIPAIDVAYVHDTKSVSNLPYPLYHTEYDNFDFVKTFVDPTFKYHATVVKVLGELLRDLSDSLFIPFNLFDYAQVLQNFHNKLLFNFGQDLEKHGINLSHLGSAVKNFTNAAYKFHSTQETVDLSDPMTVRCINDQLLLLERAFLDHNGLPRNTFKKHVIMSPSESVPSNEDMFPGLLDEFASLSLDEEDSRPLELIRAHFSVLVFTIQAAAKTISDV